MNTNLDKNTKRQTKYWMISGIIVLILLVFASSAIEYKQSRQEYLHVLQQEGELVAGLIFRGGRMAMTGNERMEKMAFDQMQREAELIQNLDRQFSPDIRPIIEHMSGFRNLELLIFDADSKVVFPPKQAARKRMRREKRLIRDFIKSGEAMRPVHPKESGPDRPLPPALLIQRKNGQGAIMLSPRMPEHMRRRRFGVGSFLSELVDNENIEYVIFQKNSTILAHAGIKDSTLFAADVVKSGIVRNINNKPVFEYSKKIRRGDDDADYFVRVGISANNLAQLEKRLLQRLLISSLIITLIAGLAWVFLLNRQRLQLVSERFKHYQSYTANILQNMVEGVIALDKTGELSFINTAAQQILDPKNEHMTQKTEHLLKLLPDQISTLIKKRQIVHDIDFEYLHDHQKKKLSLTTSAIYSKMNHAESYILLLRDISQLAELQAQMQRKEKLNAMGQLASGVAHEIRNPLNAIGVIIQRLNREFRPNEGHDEYKQLTQSMRSEVSRVNEIIESFLRFARPPRVQMERTDISVLTNEVALLYSASMQEAGITPDKQLEPGLTADVDANQFKQALINLLRNALDAAPPASSIQIQTLKKDAQIAISIADEGAGISAEDQSRIFDLYYSTKDHGSGLGLSIVQQIVSAHGGRIKIESPRSDTGNGCRFTILIDESNANGKE